MKLELKHLAPYIPYKLKYISPKREGVIGLFETKEETIEKMGLIGVASIIQSEGYLKPILRPLSDLLKDEFFHKVFNKDLIDKELECLVGVKPKECAKDFINSDDRLDFCYPLSFWQSLNECHFDYNNLIQNNLAIDINTLNQEA